MNNTLCAVAFVLIALHIAYKFLVYPQLKPQRLAKLRKSEDVLLKWVYSPDEWQTYCEDASSGWIKHKQFRGEAFIKEYNIIVTNGHDEYDFGIGRTTKNCSYYRGYLDFYREWTSSASSHSQTPTTHFEDFRLYVPKQHEKEMLELLAELQIPIDASNLPKPMPGEDELETAIEAAHH